MFHISFSLPLFPFYSLFFNVLKRKKRRPEALRLFYTKLFALFLAGRITLHFKKRQRGSHGSQLNIPLTPHPSNTFISSIPVLDFHSLALLPSSSLSLSPSLSFFFPRQWLGKKVILSQYDVVNLLVQASLLSPGREKGVGGKWAESLLRRS